MSQFYDAKETTNIDGTRNKKECIGQDLFHCDVNGVRCVVGLNNVRVQTAIQFITEHVSSDISVNDVAAFVGVGTRQLNRLLLSLMDTSTKELINRIKIKTAKEFIKTSNMTLTKISVKCGFNSLSSFSRTFKKITGVSPKMYRENEKEKSSF